MHVVSIQRGNDNVFVSLKYCTVCGAENNASFIFAITLSKRVLFPELTGRSCRNEFATK